MSRHENIGVHQDVPAMRRNSIEVAAGDLHELQTLHLVEVNLRTIWGKSKRSKSRPLTLKYKLVRLERRIVHGTMVGER